MLDEMAHAGPEHLDEAFIAGFDRKQGYPDPSADIEACIAVRHAFQASPQLNVTFQATQAEGRADRANARPARPAFRLSRRVTIMAQRGGQRSR
jgi:hypothetical protein